MAQSNERVILKRGKSATLPTEKESGAILMETDTGTCYVDNSSTDRVQLKDPTKLPLSGGTMTGDIDMGKNNITSSHTPSDDEDVVNKEYVDSKIYRYTGKEPIIVDEDTISHKEYGSKNGGPTSNSTLSFGGSFTVPYEKSDDYGHITDITNRTLTLPKLPDVVDDSQHADEADHAKESDTSLDSEHADVADEAKRLSEEQTIDGVAFDGLEPVVHYGVCSTAAGTAAKTVSCDNFVLDTGANIEVKFDNTNTASAPTLNVNKTGAKSIRYAGSALSSSTADYISSDHVYRFVYDGSYYNFVGDIGGSGTIDDSKYALKEYYGNTFVSVGRKEGTDVGDYSFAFGRDCTARASYAHAEGDDTGAYGISAHAEGNKTSATGEYSHAEGQGTEASGKCSHVEGYQSYTENVDYAHAEGYITFAGNTASHAEGGNTTSSGEYSHAEGYYSQATCYASHAEGADCEAAADYAHAEGYKTVSGGEGICSHAEGGYTKTTMNYCHAEGYYTEANGDYSHAEGGFNKANANYCHAEGGNTEANGSYSHAEGWDTRTHGMYSHAEGEDTSTEGQSSHAEGSNTYANSFAAHSEGSQTDANGSHSHAEGCSTTADGGNSHAEGDGPTAIGEASHAEGKSTTASTDYSHASGYYTQTGGATCQTVIGHRNRVSTSTGGVGNTNGDGFIIGNGLSESNLGNAFRVTFDGTTYGLSSFNSSGADYAEFIKEWYDGNPDEEDRVGYFVTIKDGLLYKAEETDYIVGITSGNPSVVGNADEEYYWKYERDEFGRIVTEDADEEIIEPIIEIPQHDEDSENNESEVQTLSKKTKSKKSKTSKDEEDENTEIIEDENGNKYKVTKTGNIIKDGIMVLSEDYDSSLQSTYTERKDRPEWDYVGMLGVIPVRDDGTCKVDAYCKCGGEGIATFAEERGFDTYRVIERVTENVVLVIMR